MPASRASVGLGLLLAATLLSAACSPSPNPAAGTGAPSVSADRGAALYAQNCVPCHHENGEGVPKVFPSLTGSAAVVGDPVELAQWVLSQAPAASTVTIRSHLMTGKFIESRAFPQAAIRPRCYCSAG